MSSDAGKKLTKREVRMQVYEGVAARLEREVMCDVDDPDFIDVAMPIQQEIADRLTVKAARIRATLSEER